MIHTTRPATVTHLVLICSSFFAATFGTAWAGSTPWLTDREMNTYVKKSMVGKSYGTAIDCKDSSKGPILKIISANFPPGYVEMTGTDKFFRWYWVIAEDAKLQRDIASLRRKDKPHLKWRVVHRKSAESANGKKMTCAIIYR